VIGFGGLLSNEGGPLVPRCSRAGCDSDAVAAIHWRNPKIHGMDRVKTWTACDEHTVFLREFLAARNFPVYVTPLDQVVDRLPDASQQTTVGDETRSDKSTGGL